MSSIVAERNRNLTDDFMELLDPVGVHVVNWSMVHNDCEFRVNIYAKIDGTMVPASVYLDMSMEEYGSLKYLYIGDEEDGQ